MKYRLPIIIIFVVLLLDQALKIYIKTHYVMGEEHSLIFDWFRIHFTENEGMAFGWSLGGNAGKLGLSIFRIIAVGFIGYYMMRLIRDNAPRGLVICLALILAGALGNIIDSAFYGVIFNHSHGQVASMFPEEGGYAGLMFGKVVDMLYFPIIRGYWPDWIPVFGGKPFEFFRPVFNIADASITTGVLAIILFQRQFFVEDKPRTAAEQQP